jgi:hypothetical protein
MAKKFDKAQFNKEVAAILRKAIATAYSTPKPPEDRHKAENLNRGCTNRHLPADGE